MTFAGRPKWTNCRHHDQVQECAKSWVFQHCYWTDMRKFSMVRSWLYFLTLIWFKNSYKITVPVIWFIELTTIWNYVTKRYKKPAHIFSNISFNIELVYILWEKLVTTNLFAFKHYPLSTLRRFPLISCQQVYWEGVICTLNAFEPRFSDQAPRRIKPITVFLLQITTFDQIVNLPIFVWKAYRVCLLAQNRSFVEIWTTSFR